MHGTTVEKENSDIQIPFRAHSYVQRRNMDVNTIRWIKK